MTDLDDPRERLARELDRHPHAALDLDRLVVSARTRGTVVRRRRRAAVTAGVAALLAVGAVGVVSALPEPTTESRQQVADDPTPTPTPTPSDTPPPAPQDGPATARGAVAALDWAVRQQVAGTTSDYFGQPPEPELEGFGRDYYAQLVFDDGGGAGEVGLNVQFAIGFVGTCENSSWGVDCESRALPGGGRITTYDDVSGAHVRRVADLHRADGVRVVVSASNGFDLGGNEYDVRRSEPAFTADQLAAVVQAEFWGETLPTRFLEAGERLRPFREESAFIEATPLPD
jgi:hypothetical protein